MMMLEATPERVIGLLLPDIQVSQRFRRGAQG